MSGIVQRWITKQTGLHLDLTKDSFNSQVSDGKVFAHLLYSYGVINKNMLDSIPNAENINETLVNMSKVAEWLIPLNINLNEDILLEIASGVRSTAIRFLYQLYLALEEKFKGKTPHIEPEQHVPSVNSSLEEEEEHSIAFYEQDHPLSAPLLINRNIIQWHKDKYATLTEKCNAMRQAVESNLRERYETKTERNIKIDRKSIPYTEIPEDLNLRFRVDSVDFTYEQLLQQQEHAVASSGVEPNYSIASEIVERIRKKRRKIEREKELQVHMGKMLINEVWEDILKKDEEKLHETVVKKLQKQSAFEKRMIEKLLEVQQHKHCILDNKRRMEERLKKEREDEMWRLKNLPRETSFDRLVLEHKRLYNERMKAKAEKHFTTCWEMIKDIVDISLRNAEYTEGYGEEVPDRLQRDWRNLFIGQKPIMDIVENVEDIVDENVIQDEIEDIITAEIHRQNLLDLKDFEAYLLFQPPWELLPYQSEKYEIAQLGMNVLGFAIHRLLALKYPKIIPPKIPGLPDFSIAVCIRGVSDLKILPRLQKLLTKRKVQIIQINEVVEFCQKALETELIYEYPDIPRKSIVEEAKTVTKKGEKKPKPKPPPKGKEKEKAKLPIDEGRKDKNVQTPRLFPSEIPELTPQAQLALELKRLRTPKIQKTIVNEEGEEEIIEEEEEEDLSIEPTDELLVAMFLEFLKSLKDSEGWALINFPESVPQTILLEEALGNKKIDPSGIDLTDLTSSHRNSKIVSNPKAIEDDPYFQTYLTAFITIIPEYDKNQSEIEEDDDLTKMYTNQGCHYSLYFKSTDLPFVKHLAKLILGDFTLPRKTSLELFGDTILYLEAYTNEEGEPKGKAVKKGEKKKPEKKAAPKPKKEKKPSKTTESQGKDSKKGGKSPKGGKTPPPPPPPEMFDKEIQFPDMEEEVEETEELPEPEPGQEGWVYIELPIGEQVGSVISSVWENAEMIYVGDLRELFFLLRTLHSTVIPYMSYIRNHMEAFITRSNSLKQDILNDFQNMYNLEAADLRNDVQFKAEYHKRIADLREKLWEICDVMMKESEAERQRIIKDNWIAIQACEMTNNYINAFQIEIDLDVDTQAVMFDYYMGLITQQISDLTIPSKVLLKRIDTPSFLSASEKITQVLENLEADSNNIPLYNYLESAYHTALQAVNKWHADAIVNRTKIYNLFNPTKATKSPKFFEPTEDVKEEGERIVQEYECVLHGEHERVLLRLELLKEDGLKNLKELIRYSTDIFHKFFNELTNRYYSEVANVDTVCELLARAVEEEIRIQPQLTLENAQFFIQPNLLCFPDPPPLPEPPLEELERDGLFKIKQLENLRKILLDLAPSGKIPERVFTFLLQDMIIQDAEDGADLTIPKLWMELRPNQVGELIQKLFGNCEMIDWKEFIIFNLGVKYPTEEELMDIRKQFKDKDPNKSELIREVEYPDIHFWFEDTSSDSAQFTTLLIRQLLFDLYKIDDYRLNYPALLLAFCKDMNPPRGVAKAIQLSLGKYVCYDYLTGDHFIRSVRIDRVLDEIEQLDAVIAAENAILTAADRGIHQCSSVIIEEVIEDIVDEIVSIEEEHEQEAEAEEEEDISGERNSESHLSLLLEDKFSNIAIGFEARDCPSLVYFLPFEVIEVIMSVQGDYKLELEDLYNKMRLGEFNNSVLTHEFLNCERFQQILYRGSRFMAINPLRHVASLVLNTPK